MTKKEEDRVDAIAEKYESELASLAESTGLTDRYIQTIRAEFGDDADEAVILFKAFLGL